MCASVKSTSDEQWEKAAHREDSCVGVSQLYELKEKQRKHGS
jgi:hypothetical protein